MAAVAPGEHRHPGAGQAGEARVGLARAAASRAAETRCGGVRVTSTFGPAQAVVVRHPDQIGRRGAGARVLEEDREGAPAGGLLDVRR